MSSQPGQNNLPPRNSTSASGGISSDVSSAILRPVLMQVPPPDKTGLQARKRFVDGGGAEDGNGTIYRSVAYRTEGLFKFSGDFLSTFLLGSILVVLAVKESFV